MIKEICSVNIDPIVTQEYRLGDTRHDFADISKAKRELGFEPKWEVKKGLRELARWAETKEAMDIFERADKERKILQRRGEGK